MWTWLYRQWPGSCSKCLAFRFSRSMCALERYKKQFPGTFCGTGKLLITNNARSDQLTVLPPPPPNTTTSYRSRYRRCCNIPTSFRRGQQDNAEGPARRYDRAGVVDWTGRIDRPAGDTGPRRLCRRRSFHRGRHGGGGVDGDHGGTVGVK